jgi:hypothetical protein
LQNAIKKHKKQIWLTVLLVSTYRQKFSISFLSALICKVDGSLYTLIQSPPDVSLNARSHPPPDISLHSLVAHRHVFLIPSESLTSRRLFIHPYLPTTKCPFILSEPLSVRCLSIRPESHAARYLFMLSSHPPPDVSVYTASHPLPDASVYTPSHPPPDASV